MDSTELNNSSDQTRTSPLILRLTEVMLPPIELSYKVSAVLLRQDSGFPTYTKLKPQQMSAKELLSFLNENARGPTLIAHLSEADELGWYSFIDGAGKIMLQKNGHKAAARYFARLLVEDAVLRSNEGTGIFEIRSVRKSGDREDDVITGEISRYASRANKLLRSIGCPSLASIGVTNMRRRDPVSDEYGNSLPAYRYDLKCSVILIRSTSET